MYHFPKADYTLRYAFVSQRGYYPDALDKPNQDAFDRRTAFGSDKTQALFGVFDGHGESGTQCAQYVRDKVRALLQLGRLRARCARARASVSTGHAWLLELRARALGLGVRARTSARWLLKGCYSRAPLPATETHLA